MIRSLWVKPHYRDNMWSRLLAREPTLQDAALIKEYIELPRSTYLVLERVAGRGRDWNNLRVAVIVIDNLETKLEIANPLDRVT